MSGVFDDITLEWNGGKFVVPARKVMGLLHKIEDVITLREISTFTTARETVPLSRIASAYAVALRYAGAEVDDDVVYAAMFSGAENSAEVMETAITVLLGMMVPPQRAAVTMPGESPPAAAGSSKKPSKRR